MGNVFISYRRSDATSGYASWIYDRLATTFGAGKVFIDIDSVPLGVDFVDHLERTLATADVLLVLIGPRWADARDRDGLRRLDDAHDFVRMEIAIALRAGIRVIPMLCEGADMPTATVLPDDIRPLARRQALVVERRGGRSLETLVAAIEKMVRERDREKRVSAAVGDQERERVAIANLTTIPVGQLPQGLAVDDYGLWVANTRDDTVIRLDGRSGAVVGTPIPVGKSPTAIATARHSVWVVNSSDNTVTRVDADLGTVVDPPIPVGPDPGAIAVSHGRVWVANNDDYTLTQIDEQSGDVICASIPIANHGYAILDGPEPGLGPVIVANDAVWTINSGDCTVVRLDPVSGARLGDPVHVPGFPVGLAPVADTVWVLGYDGDITRLDAVSGKQIDSVVRVPGPVLSAAADQDVVWIPDCDGSVIRRYRVESGEPIGQAIPVGSEPTVVAVGHGAVWTANDGDNTVTRIPWRRAMSR